MESSFLPNLSRRLSRTVSAEAADPADFGNICFHIGQGPDGMALLTVRDSDMRPIELPDYRHYSGETCRMLRALSLIRNESRFDVTWGESGLEVFNLWRHPMLIYQLVRCDNIVEGTDNRPVQVRNERAILSLDIAPKTSGSDVAESGLPKGEATAATELEARWRLETPLPDAGYDRRADGWYMLTDSYVMSSGEIYAVDPVGDNFKELRFFESTLPASIADGYLSVVYSYLDNFALNFEGRTVERAAEPVEMKPALVFERVDSDLALHLRVTSSLRGLDEMFVRRFDLTNVVSLAKDGRVIVRSVTVRDLKNDIADVRELLAKYAPTRRQGREVYLERDTFIIPSEVASPFLLKGLPQLLNEYVLMGTDRLRDYKVAPVKPRLRLNLSSGVDFLEGDATVELGDEKMSIGKLIEQYRRDKYVTMRDGTRAVLDASYMKRLERLFGDKRTAGRKVRLSYFDLHDVEDMLSEKLDPSLFKRQREFFEGFNSLASQPLPRPAVNATLRHYQEEGVKWIKYLYEKNMGGCLADDMGLGKTIQTISVLSGIYPRQTKSTLIVMPRSLLFNWQKEIERFCPTLTTYVYYQGTRDLAEAMKHQVILTTYAMVRNDIEKFSQEEFHYIILDESQNIKNITAQVTRAVYLLKGEHRLALSGTPIENNLTELYSLFRFLNPGMLGDLDDFNRRYATPIQKEDDSEAMTSLRCRIYPFMLRRLKRDVLAELPDRTDQQLFVDMDQRQAEYYDQRRRYYLEKIAAAIKTEGVAKSQFVMLQALTELRRIASVPESMTDGDIKSPKLEVLLESLEEAVASGHKCVVFFNYVAGLELAAEYLTETGIGFETMTGATTDRRRVVERFDRDPSCMVLLMTLKTGGVGLNLTVADTVYIFEPWWNKAAEEQAINRLHRFGQQSKVLSYSLIARGTIEEKILELQAKKTALYEALISTDGSSLKHLSAEDIDFLLK